MTQQERADMLEGTIRQLYSNEGHSKAYIGKLLDIDRGVISDKVAEWKLKPLNNHLRPSVRKQINKNVNWVISRLNQGDLIENIASKLDLSTEDLLQDESVRQAHLRFLQRKQSEDEVSKSHSSTIAISDPEERWKGILGFSCYEASTNGRVRRKDNHRLLTPSPNILTGRLYISLIGDGGKRKNLQLARVIAQTFIDHDSTYNTVNHKDGNILNNCVENLEWMTQAENNLHAYRSLNRRKVCGRRFTFKRIKYKGRYEFKTVAAFARFLGKSETQTRRYLDDPESHDIQLIGNCID